MEHQKGKLQQALAKLPTFEPQEDIWAGINRVLDEFPLQNALQKLPFTEPDESVWRKIEGEIGADNKLNLGWWYAAAVIFLTGFGGFWFVKNQSKSAVAYSQETIDLRLQVKNEPLTDQQYEKLKSYCEAETIVCGNKNFRRLQEEYETLSMASKRLQQAMGNYNTEPELIRQFSLLEQEKAEVLNEMAKMI